MRRRLVNVHIDASLTATEVDVAGTRVSVAFTHDVLGVGADVRVREAASAAVRTLGPVVDAEASIVKQLEAKLADTLAVRRVRLVAACPRMETLSSSVQLHPRLAQRLGLPAPEGDVLSALPRGATLAVDGVHLLEGDLAPLPRLLDACASAGAQLAVVDALGFGVLGPQGGGVVEHLGLRGHVDFQVLGLRSLGAVGWAIAGRADWVDAVAAHDDGVLSAPSVAAALAGLEIAQAEPHRRARLFELTEQLLLALRAMGLDTGPAVTPWIPVLVGDEALTEQWARAAAETGVVVHALLDGTASRVLLALPATTSDAQLAAVVNGIERTCRRVPLPAVRPATSVLVSRPGTYIISAPCSPAWGVPQHAPDHRPLSARPIFDVFETLTWKAANARRPSWPGMASLRALVDRTRRGK
ncbi:MAG: hypothetical protein JNG84_03615 [Archangium sp.]|nr:hypothetical protein [Archangium sp.]